MTYYKQRLERGAEAVTLEEKTPIFKYDMDGNLYPRYILVKYQGVAGAEPLKIPDGVKNVYQDSLQWRARLGIELYEEWAMRLVFEEDFDEVEWKDIDLLKKPTPIKAPKPFPSYHYNQGGHIPMSDYAHTHYAADKHHWHDHTPSYHKSEKPISDEAYETLIEFLQEPVDKYADKNPFLSSGDDLLPF